MKKKSPNNPLPKPSDAELRILRVLWDRGPSTVREVFEALELETGVGYTTFLKLLQIMFDKGLADRDTSARSHIYSAVPTRAEVEERFLGDLLENVFAGSKKRLVLQILSEAKSSKEEMDEIRKLFRQLDTQPEDKS